jgi:hypothetical protein
LKIKKPHDFKADTQEQLSCENPCVQIEFDLRNTDIWTFNFLEGYLITNESKPSLGFHSYSVIWEFYKNLSTYDKQ